MHAMLSDHLERRAGLLTTTVALAALAILCREAELLVADATIPWIPLGIAAALMLRFGLRHVAAYAAALTIAATVSVLRSPPSSNPVELGLAVGIPPISGAAALLALWFLARGSRPRLVEGRIDLRSALNVFLLATPLAAVVWTLLQPASSWWFASALADPTPLLMAGLGRWLGLLAGLPITLALLPSREHRMTYACHCEQRHRVQIALLAIPALVFGFQAADPNPGHATLTLLVVTIFAWAAINSGWLASSVAVFTYLVSTSIAAVVLGDASAGGSPELVREAGLTVFAATAAALIGAVAEDHFRQRSDLRDQQATVDHLVRTVDAMTIQLDLDGNIDRLNNQARTFIENLAGEDAIVGRRYDAVLSGRLRARIAHGLQEAVENRRTEFDFVLNRPPHARRFLAAIVTPLHDQYDRVRGCSVVLMDLSQRRRREMARRRADHRKLKSLAEAVVHDVNNLTMAIGGTASLARERPNDTEIERVLAEIERTCDDAANRAERLRYVIPQRKTANEAVDLGGLVRSIVTEYADSGRINAVTIDVEDDLRVAIPLRFATFAIQEFLQNAIDATRHGPPSIFVVCRRSDDGCVLCHLRDDGPGIPLDLIDRIGSNIVSTKGGGRGFGLRAIQTGIEAAGGRFTIRSDDAGTAVVIELPRQLDAELSIAGR